MGSSVDYDFWAYFLLVYQVPLEEAPIYVLLTKARVYHTENILIQMKYSYNSRFMFYFLSCKN